MLSKCRFEHHKVVPKCRPNRPQGGPRAPEQSLPSPKVLAKVPWSFICALFSIPFAWLGPMISQGSSRRPILSTKRPSGQQKSSKHVGKCAGKLPNEFRISNTVAHVFWHSASNSTLQATLFRSTSLDPLRHGNFVFVRSTLLYDD